MRNFAILAVAALLLTGCYSSDTPFITPDTADYPFPDGTQFIDHSDVGGVKTARLLDGYYAVDATHFLVRAIGHGFYILQSCQEGRRTQACDYALLKRDGKTIKRYDGDPRCAVEDCPVGSWGELVAALRRDYNSGDQFVSYEVQ